MKLLHFAAHPLVLSILPFALSIAAVLGLGSMLLERAAYNYKEKQMRKRYAAYRAEMRAYYKGATLMFRLHNGKGYTHLITLNPKEGQQQVELLDVRRI